MKSDQIMGIVQKVLKHIQASGSLKCPKLDSSTKPLKELEEFNSPASIGATGMVAREIGIKLDPKINLFGNKNEAFPLSKTVAILSEALSQNKKSAEANV